jgi:hypothetical protein
MTDLALLPQLLAHITTARPPKDGFSFVEHAWHLADVELEAFMLRIRRLLDEDAPRLIEFDGDRVARERGYRDRPLAPAVERFRIVRAATIERFAALSPVERARAGTFAGARITLDELGAQILAHDRAHARELTALVDGDVRFALERFADAVA